MNKTTAAQPGPPDTSPVVRAFRLFAHVARAVEPPMLAELSRAIGLPKPTTYRLALLLEGAGYLYKDPQTLRYSVGPRFEEIALTGLRNGGAGGARRLVMEGLARRLGARVNFVVLRAGAVASVEWVESTSALRVDLDPHTEVPAHCSAGGKLLMAHAPEPLRRRFLESAPYGACTPRTITGARAFAQELERIRKQDYAEDDEEFIPGVNCLAVPVRNDAGEVVAALAVMAPVATLPLSKARGSVDELRRAADALAVSLGWRHAPALAYVGEAKAGAARPRRKALA